MMSLLLSLGAFVVATSAPGLAVAHGYAHLHAAGHARDQGAVHVDESDREKSARVEDAEHGAHQHPQSDAAVPSRASAAQFVAAAVVALTLGTDVPVAAAAPRAEPVDVPDGPPPDRATQPRAPPLG